MVQVRHLSGMDGLGAENSEEPAGGDPRVAQMACVLHRYLKAAPFNFFNRSRPGPPQPGAASG